MKVYKQYVAPSWTSADSWIAFADIEEGAEVYEVYWHILYISGEIRECLGSYLYELSFIQCNRISVDEYYRLLPKYLAKGEPNAIL